MHKLGWVMRRAGSKSWVLRGHPELVCSSQRKVDRKVI